jgi:Tol biopolymer transport system component
LVFGSNREYETVLWRISARGGVPRRVPDTAGGDALTAVSCSLRQLTFTRLVTDENIWEAQVSGVGLRPKPRKLISSTRGDSNPQYSPDGTRIAVASDRSGAWQIWVCDRDGSDSVRLTNFRHGGSAWPTWSPDGKRLAFDSNGAGGDEYQLFTVAAEGGPPQQLTVGPTLNSAPSWSTDGWIYFESNRTDGFQVWKIPQSGGAAVRVTKHGGSRPAVSPDGKFVYYAKGQDEVWRIPAAGGEETRLMAGLEDVFHGRWAPVERGFYFLQRIGPKLALKFLDFDTGRTVEIMPLDKPWGIFALSVSPDRRSVLYSQIDSGAHALFMIENYH